MKTCTKQLLTVMITSALMAGPAWAANQEVSTMAPTITQAATQGDQESNNAIMSQVANQASEVSAQTGLRSTFEGKPVGYFTGIGDVMIDQSVPSQPFAVLQPGAEMNLPYGDEVSDADIAKYIGKTITSIQVANVEDKQLEEALKKRFIQQVGDAVQANYLRHDVNILGASGLFATIKPTFQVVPEGVKLIYVVKQNPRITRISIRGNKSIPATKLHQLLNIKPGMTLNTTFLSKDVANINLLYNNWGYMISHVSEVKMNDSGVLCIGISEAQIEDIRIRGNIKTKDHVILREMRLGKGDIFNKELVSRSIQRIYNTGYFEDVNVRLLQGQQDPQNVILEIEVAEQKTGSITIGAGYSDADGFVGVIGLSETNLRGTGDKVNINWEFGGKSRSNKNHSLSYTHPWLNKYGDSLGFSLYDRKGQQTDYGSGGKAIATYEKKTRGLGITYGRSRGEYSADYFTLELKKSEYVRAISGKDYLANDVKSKQFLKNNFGRSHSLTWAHVFDNRDNVFDPSRGKRISLTSIVTGYGLGGDFKYTKFIAEARTYHKVSNGRVLAFRLMGGMGFGSVPYNELFALGGADTIRGYEDDEFRGKKMYAATLEYRYPIAKKIQGVVFADVGNAWGGTQDIEGYQDGNKLHAAGGLGFRVTTPIGPVRLDYAWGQNGGKFHFSFGGKF